MGWLIRYMIERDGGWDDRSIEEAKRTIDRCLPQELLLVSSFGALAKEESQLVMRFQPPPLFDNFYVWFCENNPEVALAGAPHELLAREMAFLLRSFRNVESQLAGSRVWLNDGCEVPANARVGELDPQSYESRIRERFADSFEEDTAAHEKAAHAVENDVRMRRVTMLLEKAAVDFERWKSSKRG